MMSEDMFYFLVAHMSPQKNCLQTFYIAKGPIFSITSVSELAVSAGHTEVFFGVLEITRTTPWVAQLCSG